jgi:hypothetical protein
MEQRKEATGSIHKTRVIVNRQCCIGMVLAALTEHVQRKIDCAHRSGSPELCPQQRLKHARIGWNVWQVQADTIRPPNDANEFIAASTWLSASQ